MTNIRKKLAAILTAAIVGLGLLAPATGLAEERSCHSVPGAVAAASGGLCTGSLAAAAAACTTLVWFDFGTTCGVSTMVAAASCGVSVGSVGAMIANCVF